MATAGAFTPAAALFSRDHDPLQCQTQRAPDYYGLGVRLGVYFAWFQAYIANNMVPAEIGGATDTNTIFLLAILVAMIECSHIQMLGQIDGLILMHLAGGTIFGVLSLWGYRTRQYRDQGPGAIRFWGGFGTHGRLIVSLAVSSFGLWYWLYGVTGTLWAMGSDRDTKTDDPKNPPECGVLYTFMFAKVRADGGIRIFYIFVCICCIIYFGIMLLASSLAGWARAKTMRELARNKRWADSSRLRFATGFKYKELTFIHKTLRILNLAWLIFSILLVECTLNFNHVTAVLGGPHDNELHLPSQLLPLLIGAFGFVRISYLLFEQYRSPGDAEPSRSGPVPDSPRAARTMHFDRVLQAFSPGMSRDSRSVVRDPEEVDVLERRRGRAVRYLVAWLPWLSLLEMFRGEEAEAGMAAGKRWSAGSQSVGGETLRLEQRSAAEGEDRRLRQHVMTA